MTLLTLLFPPVVRHGDRCWVSCKFHLQVRMTTGTESVFYDLQWCEVVKIEWTSTNEPRTKYSLPQLQKQRAFLSVNPFYCLVPLASPQHTLYLPHHCLFLSSTAALSSALH